MSDLISRSKVISVLEQLEEHSLSGKMDISNAIYLLNNTPTAYDVDKIVEELEKIKGLACRGKSCSECEYTSDCFEGEQSQKVAIDKAIKIVKQGVVVDDVCEWKVFDNSLTDEPQWVYKTTCGKYIGEEHTLKAFVYCPYCRKKIKVVEVK